MSIQQVFHNIPVYSIVPGTRAPLLGSSSTASHPPTSASGTTYTSLQNSTSDDSFLTVSLPFNFTINSTAFSTVFMGSNSYITFSAGSSVFNSLSASVPAVPKFHFGSADNSYQRVSTLTGSGNTWRRIRYEGTAATTGTVGASNIILEITLFNPSLFGGRNVLELLVGNHSRTSGQFGVANTTTYYASGTIAANQSYVFNGDSTGTSWTINTGFYVLGTGSY